HKEGIDPHYWLSPRQALVLAQNTAKALSRINPTKQEEYQQNLQRLSARIHALDSLATHHLAPLQGKNFMIFHPALTYFARDYGLNQIAIEKGGNAPTARGLKEFIDLAKKDEIKVIFIQKQFDRENAETIAREIGGQVVPFDPMAEDWETNLGEIIRLMHNALKAN
ncbi:MAG: metal ABC transporter solute-binding protein, Zn/Mn family, partial [Bacteroidales bacterium]